MSCATSGWSVAHRLVTLQGVSSLSESTATNLRCHSTADGLATPGVPAYPHGADQELLRLGGAQLGTHGLPARTCLPAAESRRSPRPPAKQGGPVLCTRRTGGHRYQRRLAEQ